MERFSLFFLPLGPFGAGRRTARFLFVLLRSRLRMLSGSPLETAAGFGKVHPMASWWQINWALRMSLRVWATSRPSRLWAAYPARGIRQRRSGCRSG